VLTSFDNTPRRDLQSSHLWSADEPDVVVERFYCSVYTALYYEACCLPRQDLGHSTLPDADGDDSFVMINSMNEWAEGMSLEPSTVFGCRLLEAIHTARKKVVANGCSGANNDVISTTVVSG
jgi:hypothetical protein